MLRVSGPAALELTRPLAPDLPSPPLPRHAHFTNLVDRKGQLLDQGLFLYFPAPHSFTGEEVVELHTHGSPRLLSLLLSAVLEGGLARVAEPGEFSKRAFLHGKMDLARAEAVADLVSARSEAAVRAAAAQVKGLLSEKVRAIREPLLLLLAELEASLEFPEEVEGAGAEARWRLLAALEAARALLAQAERGRLLRRGARVVLYGPVNAGKSTLFNRLLGEERALVDEEPGTTRDLLEATLELSGLAVTLVDSAGLREEAGRVEALGMERTRLALAGADLALLVLPPEATAAQAGRWEKEASSPVLRLAGKADLGPAGAAGSYRVSGKTGKGVEALRAELCRRLGAEGEAEAVALTSERHAEALRRAALALERAAEAQKQSTLEVVAGELGLAVEALGEITGENAPGELLETIFRRFCIGK